jgi:hypothetical protein
MIRFQSNMKKMEQKINRGLNLKLFIRISKKKD